jgi:hypothetical protein
LIKACPAAFTTPLPFDFNIPLTVPAPPTLLPIVVPLQVPEVIVPTEFKLDNDVNVEFEVAVIFPAVVAVVAFPKKLGAVRSCVNLPFPCTSNWYVVGA